MFRHHLPECSDTERVILFAERAHTYRTLARGTRCRAAPLTVAQEARDRRESTMC
jgi:hypothetical protein